VIWFFVTVIAPFTLPANSLKNFSDILGTIDNEDTIEGMNSSVKAIYMVEDSYCHQTSDRSYYLNGNRYGGGDRDPVSD
jgi:hypothetical protein